MEIAGRKRIYGFGRTKLCVRKERFFVKYGVVKKYQVLRMTV